jgi:hypothetical protein
MGATAEKPFAGEARDANRPAKSASGAALGGRHQLRHRTPNGPSRRVRNGLKTGETRVRRHQRRFGRHQQLGCSTVTSTTRNRRTVIRSPPSARKQSNARSVTICATILEEEAPGLYFDTAFLIGPAGEIAGKYRKTHSAAVLSLEKIYSRGGTRFPNWNVKGFRVGAIICYDHFFPEAARCSAVNGED